MIVIGEGVCHWVADRTTTRYYEGSGQGIGIEKDGRLVCGVMYEGFNGRAVQIHVALEPGARMTREWFHALFDYAFNKMGVTKIIGVIDSGNTASLRFTRHIGFVEEAVIKDAGKIGDMHILTMTRQQCRFLRSKP